MPFENNDNEVEGDIQTKSDCVCVCVCVFGGGGVEEFLGAHHLSLRGNAPSSL
jgi:hypothetical protein